MMTLRRPALRWFSGLAALCALAGCLLDPVMGRANEGVTVDTALILAIDVSNSVDAARYTLQMEGVARALEDDGVIDAIVSGLQGGILLTLVAWSDRAEVAMPWQISRSAADAKRVANIVRTLPQRAGEYTCAGSMMSFVSEIVLPSVPGKANRLVVDVSGDGIDNCVTQAVSDSDRDKLIASGATINGLPIIVKGENDLVGSGTYRRPGFALEDLGLERDTTTLDVWYKNHIIGGPGAFLKTAEGYEDFGRAFRQKFVTEISGVTLEDRNASANEPDGVVLKR